MSFAEAAGFSATLSVCLDLFGQVVAHRAGCTAGVKYGGIALQPYQLETEWRKRVRGVVDLPTNAQLSLWCKRELARLGGGGSGGRGRRSDVSSVRLAYLTGYNLLSPRMHWRGRPTREVQALVIGLVATPYLFGHRKAPRHAPEGWVGPWIEPEDLEALRDWASAANRRIQHVPRAQLLRFSDVAEPQEVGNPVYSVPTPADLAEIISRNPLISPKSRL